MEDEARGGGELENLHVKFRREAKEAQRLAAAGGGDKKKKGGGGGGKDGGGKDGGGAGAGDKAGGAGGDGQQQAEDGEEGGQLAEVDPEQQVGGRAGRACRLCSARLAAETLVARQAPAGADHPTVQVPPSPAPCYRPPSASCTPVERFTVARSAPAPSPHLTLTPPQRLMEAFKAAAEAVKEQAMPVEERVAKWLRRWMKVGLPAGGRLGRRGGAAGGAPRSGATRTMPRAPHSLAACTPPASPAQDWEADLEARPDDIKSTAGGAAPGPQPAPRGCCSLVQGRGAASVQATSASSHPAQLPTSSHRPS